MKKSILNLLQQEKVKSSVRALYLIPVPTEAVNLLAFKDIEV